LAALLYVGDYVNARHLWRRWSKQAGNTNAIANTNANANAALPPPAAAGDQYQALSDWWKVGRAMLECNAATLWQGLAHIQQTHPDPFKGYAKEVGDAYRRRILREFPPTQPYIGLLNFGSLAEMEQFCKEQALLLSMDSKVPRLNKKNESDKTSLTQVVAFLEAQPWNISKA
jgi:hypothetical protein